MLKKVAMFAVVLGLATPVMANEAVPAEKTEEAAPKTKEAKKSKAKNKKKAAANKAAAEKAAPADAAPSDADMDAPEAP
jgi:hypothetical protein